MSTDEYVPDEQDLEVAWIESEASADDINVASAEFDRFLARVRRDAAREALDGLAVAMMGTPGIGPGTKTHRARMRVDVVTYRDAHYPEETP